MNLTKKQIDEIVSKNEITVTISKYIKLEKRGSNFVAICPFHDDTTPSMHINKVKQIYKCFSCGVAGSSLYFIKRYENIAFPVALKKAAENANLNFKALDNYFSNNAKKYSNNELKTFEVNLLTMKFFKNSLNCEVGNSAYKYLKERNFSQNEIEKFDIGYATKSTELSSFLEKHGYSLFDINQSGILKDDNSYFNFFNNRLMFPIKNKEGHVIGFSGRTIGKPLNGIPKYINTNETHVFKKKQFNVQH